MTQSSAAPNTLPNEVRVSSSINYVSLTLVLLQISPASKEDSLDEELPPQPSESEKVRDEPKEEEAIVRAQVEKDAKEVVSLASTVTHSSGLPADNSWNTCIHK